MIKDRDIAILCHMALDEFSGTPKQMFTLRAKILSLVGLGGVVWTLEELVKSKECAECKAHLLALLKAAHRHRVESIDDLITFIEQVQAAEEFEASPNSPWSKPHGTA